MQTTDFAIGDIVIGPFRSNVKPNTLTTETPRGAYGLGQGTVVGIGPRYVDVKITDGDRSSGNYFPESLYRVTA